MGWFDDLTKGIKDGLRGQIDDLMKADGLSINADGDNLKEIRMESPEAKNTIGQQALIDDPFFDNAQQHFIFKNKQSRVSNKMLKDTSLRDWLVSAIIQARVDTMLQFTRPQRKQFDTGFIIRKKNEKENLTKEEKEEILNLTDFIYNCGRKEGTAIEDRMSFSEFCKLITRDAVTFGHVAVEKVKTRRKALHRFRPVAAESVYLVNQKTSREIIEKEIENSRKMREHLKNFSNRSDQEVNFENPEHYKYVQMSYDNRILAAFGDDDMTFKLFNPQNFADSMGYCYSPLELAIIGITNHLNIENYNANFFTHGYAAKGVLHLKGTVTQAQLTAFRRQFHNTISGTQHAWRTPIIAGLDDVQWVGLSGSAREMEYLNYNNHIMRSICTQFQIDPVELGLDYLVSATGRAPAGNTSNEAKINYSRERGLYPIMLMIEDLINQDIIPAIDDRLSAKYEFKFVGYTDETPQTNVALLQAEMSVYSTMNDLLKESDREAVDDPAFDVPLNQTFWQIVEKNYTRGEIRERFFGDKDASKRRELQYIPGDPAFMGWQQLLMTTDRTTKQDKLEAEQREQEAQQAQAEQQQQDAANQREQEQHDLQMKEAQARHAHAAVNHESTKDVAKEFGMAEKPLIIDGKPVANPVNKDPEDSE
jgi:hypothetical protein